MNSESFSSKKFFAAMLLMAFSLRAFAIDIAGEWLVVNSDYSEPQGDMVHIIFTREGRFITTAGSANQAKILDSGEYQLHGNELVMTRDGGERSHHPLENAEEMLRVGVPFGFFYLQRRESAAETTSSLP